MPQFFQTRNHREHDLHVPSCARSPNRTQLRLEDVDILKTKPNRAPTEKRIQFIANIDSADCKLVAAEIERANDEWVGMDPLGNPEAETSLDTAARNSVR